MQGALNWLSVARNRHLFALDTLLFLVTPALALVLRTENLNALAVYGPALLAYTCLALLIRHATHYRRGLYRRYWRYASAEDLLQIGLAVLASTILITGLFFLVRLPLWEICDRLPGACQLPRSLPFIDSLLVLVGLAGVRFLARLPDLLQRRRQVPQPRQRLLVMGAGEAGRMIVEEMRDNQQLGFKPIGFVDDDPLKQGKQIRSLPVLGGRHDIPALAARHSIDRVIIAMPTASGKEIRDVLAICERAGVQTWTMPGMYELLDGTLSVNQLRNVDIEDLLRREPISTDIAAVQAELRGRRVLVTGGGGSIGSELCRQILRCRPAELVILGHGENSVFEIDHELRERLRGQAAGSGDGAPVVPLIADIRSPERLDALFEQHRPQVVFHAAAHKHVPLMEANPAEAITNNVLGTRNVLAASLAAGVERFVMISTDKAVSPTNVMGASKRAAELLVHDAARRSQRPYEVVRFGNVLGSRGSVVQTFKRQIAAGGPVTVTHPEMCRFFMTIPEAVQLVLQAALLGNGGEVFVLDMGQPVKIVDLARDMIELSGLEVGQDVDIVYTGMRPGEKLFEELFIQGEEYGRTEHDKIFIARNASSFVPSNLDEAIFELEQAARANDRERIIRGLKELVPEYMPGGPASVAGDEALQPQQAVVKTGPDSAGAPKSGQARPAVTTA